MISNDRLWATKVQCMDDSTEFQLAKRLMKTLVDARIATEKDTTKKQKLNQIREIDRGISWVNIFAACFCEHGDLLSQWRGYSKGSYGFAVGFNSDHIYRVAEKNNFRLARCIYDEAIQTKIIEEIVDGYLSSTATAAEVEASLCQVGAFFKNHHFIDEAEWRLVSPVTDITDKLVSFRSGRSMITPYFNLPLELENPKPIEIVRVGPCPHEDLAISNVRMLLMNKDLVPDIEKSQVPYRGW